MDDCKGSYKVLRSPGTMAPSPSLNRLSDPCLPAPVFKLWQRKSPNCESSWSM